MSTKLPIEKVAEAVNRHGMVKAAAIFATSPATICRALKRNGYRIQRIYILQPEAEAVIRANKGEG